MHLSTTLQSLIEQLRAVLTQQAANPVIVLAGKAWQVQHIHDELGRVDVNPYRGGKPPQWQSGSLRITSKELATRHREVLLTKSSYSFLNDTGHKQLAVLRSTWREHLSARGIPHRSSGRRLELATFAGTKINATITKLLDPWVKGASSTAFTVTVGLHDKQTVGDVLSVLEKAASGITTEQQRMMVQDLKPIRLSKYQAFLPTEMAISVVADYLLDVPGTESYLQER